ncbi:MAG TPA: hypothetical protein VHO25_07840 [Polyangiaceae bacterium]|nr:hypothetical protein [Polyangiaceae bacterium]
MGDDAMLILDLLQGTTATPNSIVQQLARVRQADPQAVAVKEQLYGRMGIQAAGVQRTLFTPQTAMQTIMVKVIRPIQFYNLMVPSEFARFFTLHSAKINGEEQILTSQPLQTYSEVSVRSRFRWEKVTISSPLALQIIMNDLTVDRFFECTFLGAALMKTEERAAKAVDRSPRPASRTLHRPSQSDLFHIDCPH